MAVSKLDDNSVVGKAAAAAIQALNQIRGLDSRNELDIPTIVFAGKQSAGKSSLVEALTGVQLPRSHGTCTRCPIQVTTVRDEDVEWQCNISLRMMDSAKQSEVSSIR